MYRRAAPTQRIQQRDGQHRFALCRQQHEQRLGEALEGGRKLVARDEAEAEQIEARVRRVLADYFGSNTLQRTGAELALKRRDPALFGHLVARVFWMRYPDVWPLQDDDQT